MQRQLHATFISKTRVAAACAQISLLLAASLPFLSFFDASRNIDWQGIILIIAGGFAWSAIALQPQFILRLPRSALVPLAVFMVGCVISALVSPHVAYGLLGAPYVRLGSLGLLSCGGCGLVAARQLPARILMTAIYIGICLLAVLSIPYTLYTFHSLLRIGGLFAQADIMACFMGVGFMLGFGMLRTYKHRRPELLTAQALLAAVLWLTQTRAVLVLVLVLGLVWLVRSREARKRIAVYVLATLALLAVLTPAIPDRLSSTAYASSSITYRLHLQESALRASAHKPAAGYGPGNLADALSCRQMRDAALLKTCRQGYFFNSSHNIFIDRLLGAGWVTGGAFLVFVIIALIRGLQGKTDETRLLGFGALLIACYYLTNVTSATLELLFWTLMMACLVPHAAVSRASASR